MISIGRNSVPNDWNGNGDFQELAVIVEASAPSCVAKFEDGTVRCSITREEVGRDPGARSSNRSLSGGCISSEGDERGDFGGKVEVLGGLKSGSQVILCHERCLD